MALTRAGFVRARPLVFSALAERSSTFLGSSCPLYRLCNFPGNFRPGSAYHYRPGRRMMDFHSLYQSYAPQVHRFVLFLCGDASLADDITSETFVRAWTARGKIREATVKAYLFTIAR